MCSEKKEDSFSRDVDYWNAYYKKNLKEIQEPSDFAKTMISYLEEGRLLVDLGCGNGRDSVYFSENGINVIGIDASQEAISRLNSKGGGNRRFLCDDFVTSPMLYQAQYDYFYSRWTIHAITEKQEDKLLKNVSDSLKETGMFFIEARSINDELYGKGKAAGQNAYIYNDHYRRFMDKEAFLNKLQCYGFEIVSVVEGKNFSKTKESDPTLIRIIAVKSNKI